jgi:hypothetical protein
MKAVVFHGAGDIRLEHVPAPQLKEPTHAIPDDEPAAAGRSFALRAR